ncbi:MAG: HEAT repeat domain-containing protein, partial [Candidatus Poribacteria bacterium]
ASAKTPQITAGLVKATNDSSETVRVRAVTSLGSAPSSDEVVTALRSALRDRSTSVRNNAILTLGKHGARSRAAASELVTILKTNSNVYSRSFAGTALGQIGSPTEDVVAALVLAMGDGAKTVRAAAKHSLTILGDPAVSALSRQMAGGSAGAREVLQTIGTPGALAVLGGK